MFSLLLITCYIVLTEACSNYPSIGVGSSDVLQPRARGQSTHLVANKPSTIVSSTDLNCYDFDDSCRWKNMEGLFVDELDWFQGSGIIDQQRLLVATGASTFPEGMYAIVGTDTAQLPTAKAVFVSDVIGCQRGPGQLSFLYWTTPDVRLKVCAKTSTRIFPDFSYCSAMIEGGDPGPTEIAIPEQEGSFQIYIIADNFVFSAFNMQGGFAIIDNLEYEAELCEDIEKQPLNNAFDSFPSGEPLFPSLPVKPIDVDTTPKPFIAIKFGKTPNPTLIPEEAVNMTPAANHDSFLNPAVIHRDVTTSMVAACEALTCSFNSSQTCVQFAVTSSWMVSRRPVGNPLTGIRGDASDLPFNKDGSFAFINGPTKFSRLITPPFYLDRNALFVFSYHKVDKNSMFRLLAKRSDSSQESLLFEAPQINKESRRWFREGRDLLRGQYDYIAFEVQNLAVNNYMGVDEWMIVDEGRRAFCQSSKKS
ncbi:unnamed protein product [Auanema sp. JU1783]|nr:unnamed protein product [Auanema sp. JU1783]